MVAVAPGNSLLTLSDPAGDEVSAGHTVEGGLHLSTHRYRAESGSVLGRGSSGVSWLRLTLGKPGLAWGGEAVTSN